METATLTEVTNIEKSNETTTGSLSAKKSTTKLSSTKKSVIKTNENTERVTRSMTKTPIREVERSRTPLKEQASHRKEVKEVEAADASPLRKISVKKSISKSSIAKETIIANLENVKSEITDLNESVSEHTERALNDQ